MSKKEKIKMVEFVIGSLYVGTLMLVFAFGFSYSIALVMDIFHG